MQTRLWIFFLLFSLAPGLLYQFVQDQLRSGGQGIDPWVAYLLGVAPNALGALSASSALLLMGAGLSKGRRLGRVFLFSLLLGLVGLCAWEAVQIVLPRATFDPHDLAWTLAGSAVFALAAWLMFPEIGGGGKRELT